MIDFRNKVKEDQGLLKKIELAIPGFRGYRKREDLRIADSLLRTRLADNIKNVSSEMEQCKKSLAVKMDLDFLEDAGRLVDQFTAIEGKVRHAEQGYTGISPDYQITENELNMLYEWDLGLISNINEVKNSVKILQGAINAGEKNSIIKEISNLDRKIRNFSELFEKRRMAIIEIRGE